MQVPVGITGENPQKAVVVIFVGGIRLGDLLETGAPDVVFCAPPIGERKASTSTVAALFSKLVLTGQKIAMVDIVLLVSSVIISIVGVDGARVTLEIQRRKRHIDLNT